MFPHAGPRDGVSTSHKTKCHTHSGTTTALTGWSDTQTAWRFRMHPLPAPGQRAAGSHFCPVPGRLHSAPSYRGTRKSCHDRVRDPSTRSRGRFTLKAMAKEGTFIRREKKRSIQKKHSLKFRNVKSDLNKIIC